MDQGIVPPPGTPAAELAKLGAEERQLSERESDMLKQGAAVEARARQVQVALDEARAALQRLAGSPARVEAEKAFLDSLSLAVPPHVASPETSRAVELRHKALVARLQAIEAEGAAVRARATRLNELTSAVEGLRKQIAALNAAAEAARRAPPAEPAPILLKPPAVLTPLSAGSMARPASPAPLPAPAPSAVWVAPGHAPAPAPIPLVNPAAGAPAPKATSPELIALETPAAIPTQPTQPFARPQESPADVAATLRSAAPLAPPAPATESRSGPRTRLQAEVSLSSESNFFTGFSGDLSEGGVFIATYEKILPPGTPVEVALVLPGKKQVKLLGSVKWIREPNQHSHEGVFPGMGVAFENASPEALAAIKAFLGNREPMFWEG